MPLVQLLAHQAGAHALVGVTHIVGAHFVFSDNWNALVLNIQVLLQSLWSSIYTLVVGVVDLHTRLLLVVARLLHGACPCIGRYAVLGIVLFAALQQGFVVLHAAVIGVGGLRNERGSNAVNEHGLAV